MFKVTFAFENGSTVEAFANAGDNLLEVARSANVAIDAPCSGNGACGKMSGTVKKSGELDSKEKLFIFRMKNMAQVASGLYEQDQCRCGGSCSGYCIRI